MGVDPLKNETGYPCSRKIMEHNNNKLFKNISNHYYPLSQKKNIQSTLVEPIKH